MKDSMREELTKIFEAPKPVRKEAFLKKVVTCKISFVHMLSMQLRYMGRGAWCGFGVIFAAALYLGYNRQPEHLWTVCAPAPFLVLLAVTQLHRSVNNGMEELELAARFSLKDVVLARMVVQGAFNLIVLLLLTLIPGENIRQNAFYIWVPYFLTAVLSLSAMRRLRGREGSFVCAGIAAAVSAMSAVATDSCNPAFEARYLGYWVVAAVVLLMITAWECRRMIQNVEDLAWS